MLKKLSSPWVASIIGALTYLAVTVVTWQGAMKNVTAAKPTTQYLENEAPETPWLVVNPEVESLVKELRQQQQTLNEREKTLNELSQRLASERAELNQLTQLVHKMQKEFDQTISRVGEDEVVNLKKLGKTYAGMDPDAASAVFKKMDEAAIVKIMMFMRETETGPILAAMSKGGDEAAQRVADITLRLRVAVVPKTAKK